MKYGIVVDSSCDLLQLPSEFAQTVDYTRASLKLDIGEQEFVDDENLDIELFMKEMYAYKGKTGSAAPAPDAWINAFKKSEYVIAITITGEMSGTFSSAKAALDLYKEQNPACNVYILDSKSTGPEMTLLVHKLCELMAQDLPFEELITQIEAYRQHTHLMFILSSLENLVKNGRVSKVVGSIAGILGIKLYGMASEQGTLEPLGKNRGKYTAFDKTIEEMFTRGYQGGKDRKASGRERVYVLV